MLLVELLVWLVLQMMHEAASAGPPAPGPAPAAAQAGFQHDVRPILEQHCQPCHFAGGKMYAHLPFDKGETIDKVGTKLFTRIKDESERKVIRAYLDRR